MDQIILAIGVRPDLDLEEIIKGKYSYIKVGYITGVADGIASVKAINKTFAEKNIKVNRRLRMLINSQKMVSIKIF